MTGKVVTFPPQAAQVLTGPRLLQSILRRLAPSERVARAFWGREPLATDDQQRQHRELEEIRRGFVEMGARMGSLFEPAELDEQEQPAAAAPAPPPPAPARSRRWLAAALVLVFVAGGAFGYILPKGQSDNPDSPPPVAPTLTTRAQVAIPPASPRTRTSVPEACLQTAIKGDQVITLLVANIRDNRLDRALKDYTTASQACRKQASP